MVTCGEIMLNRHYLGRWSTLSVVIFAAVTAVTTQPVGIGTTGINKDTINKIDPFLFWLILLSLKAKQSFDWINFNNSPLWASLEKKCFCVVWCYRKKTTMMFSFVFFLSFLFYFRMPWSSPYVPHALLPIHHISLRARQLSGTETHSQFSSPSNCSKYSNSTVTLGQKGGVTGGKHAKVARASLELWEIC